MELTASELFSIQMALAEAASEHSHLATAPGARHEETAARYRAVRTKVTAEFDRLHPLVIR